jgi:hypothetical protein
MKLRYAIGGIAAAAALFALPAGSAASGGGQVTSLTAQKCAKERAAIGKKAFRKRYGAKHPMRACSKKAKGEVAAAVGTANSDCQDELAEIGLADFIDEFGADETDTLDNAMAECVDESLNPDDYGDVGEDDGSDG